MKKFKTYLTEMPHTNSISADKITGEWKPDRLKKDKRKARFWGGVEKHQKVSESPTHEYYRTFDNRTRSGKYGIQREFHAVNKQTGNVDMHVSGFMYGNKHKKYKVSNLTGFENSGLKAHEFYHHLIHAGHVNELISDMSQSPGAQKVWKRLSQLPNIKMGAVQQTYAGEFEPRQYNKKFEKNYSDLSSSRKYYRRLTAKANV